MPCFCSSLYVGHGTMHMLLILSADWLLGSHAVAKHYVCIVFGLLYSTMPGCVEHFIAFFSAHCLILYSVLFTACAVGLAMVCMLEFSSSLTGYGIIHILLNIICL